MNKVLIIIGIFLALMLGMGFERWRGGSHESMVEPEEKQPLYWVAPMDANYRRDKPGKSPMGMDLVPVFEESSAGASEGDVYIRPGVEQNFGVRTAQATLSDMSMDIQTVGYIQFDEETITHIHTRAEGWIERLDVASEGDRVKPGQVLFELYSPELLNAQEEYLAALASNNQSLARASARRLELLGVSRDQVAFLKRKRKALQRVPIRSEQGGYISRLHVREGMFIKPDTELMAIGDLSSVWVIAEIFERQLSWVREGQRVNMQVAGVPGRIWSGQLDYVYPVINPQSRTVQVRIRFDNTDGVLKPNMFADLTIQAGDDQARLHIPREALIRGGRYDRVVQSLGEGRYQSVVVQAGIESGEQVEIIKGLTEGDSVVTSAQFLIDSESNIDIDLARMDGLYDGLIHASGKVEAVVSSASGNSLRVRHLGIERLGWASGVTTLGLESSDEIGRFKVGDEINFCLEGSAGQYRIVYLEVAGGQTND